MIEAKSDSMANLQQFIRRATRRAGIAVRDWTHGNVDLATNEVCEVPLGETSEQMDGGEKLRTMVVVGIEGPASGRLILSFNEAHGKRLVDAVAGGCRSPAGQWDELERSTIMETGNIFASAYLSGLTELTGQTFLPTPPQFLHDYEACVIEDALMPQAMDRNESLIVRVCFRFSDHSADWEVFFVPDCGLIRYFDQQMEANDQA